MACNNTFSDVLNIEVKPCYAFYGRRGEFTIGAVADVADSLQDTYFEFEGYDNEYSLVQYYAYIGTDPALAGKTGIAVTVTTNDDAATVAGAVQAALDADANLSASVDGSIVTVKSIYFGATEAPVDTGSTGFTLSTSEAGYGGSLGATEGGVEFTTENEFVDVTTDQGGAQVEDKILIANNASVSMTLKELTFANYELLIGRFNGEKVGTGEDKIGVGESKKFKNMLQFAGELILKPINAANTEDDIYIWRGIPSVESLNFIGTETRSMPVSFTAVKDSCKAAEYSLYVIGDGTEFI